MTEVLVLPPPRPLRERLTDADGGVRLGAAAEAYSAKDPPTAYLPELARLVSDPVEDARKIAVLALARLGPEALDEIGRALEPSQPAGVRGLACQAAGSLGPAAGPLAGRVAECLVGPEDPVRQAAWVSLSRIGAPAVNSLVRVLGESTDAAVLIAAADAAGAIGEEAEPVAGPLKDASGHPDPRVKLACADALSRVSGRPASALGALLSASRAQDESLRAEAVRRIGVLQQDGHGAAKALLERSSDPSAKVRGASAIALALVGVRGDELLGTLERLLADPDPEVRVYAAAAAAHVREDARPLLPRLERMAADEDPRVVVAAGRAVEVLTGRELPKPPARVTASS